jgi:ParB family chromosome partitioning protein
MAKMGMLKNVQARTGTQDSRSVSLTVKDIPVGDIEGRKNIRKDYSGIEELTESIRQYGLLQPITVFPDDDLFVVKTGHRRFMAYKRLYDTEPERFHSIRCIVSTNDNVAIVQLVENVQREDLSQIDLCNALAALREQGMSHREIALTMGKSEGYVKNLFMGVNEVKNNCQLEALVKSHAGVTLQDVAETKAISGSPDRVKVLEQRGNSALNRAQMREKVKALKPESPVGGIANEQNEMFPPESKPSVKLTVSENGLLIKLVFNNKASAGLVEAEIRRFLRQHGIREETN